MSFRSENRPKSRKTRVDYFFGKTQELLHQPIRSSEHEDAFHDTNEEIGDNLLICEIEMKIYQLFQIHWNFGL